MTDTVDNYKAAHGFKVNHFDLAVQVMIIACSFSPQEVWLSDGDDVNIAAELVAKRAPREAGELMEYAIERGRVRLNTKLIEAIAVEQAARLHQLHTANRHEFDLPAHDGRALSHFVPAAELSALRLALADGRDDVYEAAATEKVSGLRVAFRPIDLRLSTAYIRSFHYLHAARDDDTLAFGAFIEGERMPFATVSYAPVSRNYKHNMLRTAGLDPHHALELTRAWNSEMSPKNTMSMLYAYAHACIQRLRLNTDGTNPQAILTAVNPNLGFKGSAFRAVGFGVIGEKPTAYHYLVDRDGRKSYIPRRYLPTPAPPGTVTRTHIATARLPLLPTKELAVILSGRRRVTPATKVVYRVSEAEYAREAHTTDAIRRTRWRRRPR